MFLKFRDYPSRELNTRANLRMGDCLGLDSGIDWQFRTPDARIKLRRLYPQMQLN